MSDHLPECDAFLSTVSGYPCICEPLRAREANVYLSLGFTGIGTAEYMCPNCVTPWKCNGPHIHEATWEAITASITHEALETVRQAVMRLLPKPGAHGEHYLAEIDALQEAAQ